MCGEMWLPATWPSLAPAFQLLLISTPVPWTLLRGYLGGARSHSSFLLTSSVFNHGVAGSGQENNWEIGLVYEPGGA